MNCNNCSIFKSRFIWIRQNQNQNQNALCQNIILSYSYTFGSIRFQVTYSNKGRRVLWAAQETIWFNVQQWHNLVFPQTDSNTQSFIAASSGQTLQVRGMFVPCTFLLLVVYDSSNHRLNFNLVNTQTDRQSDIRTSRAVSS